MHLLYNIVLFLASPFIIAYHLYRSLSRGRSPAFAERFGSVARERLAMLGGDRPILVHAVSVGETIAVKPLLQRLKARFPERRIVLSSGTETGRSIARTIPEADLSVYLPFDFRFAARRFLRRLRPCIVVVVETEIWPNLLRVARGMGIPALLVNGRISDRSFGRYLKLKRFFRPVLGDLTSLCMQSDEDARRIVAIGAEPDRVVVAGNIKYDIPVTVPSEGERKKLRAAFGIPAASLVVTAGSTHAGEEETVLSAYRRLLARGTECFLVLVPRHPERAAEVAEILKRCAFPFSVRSALGLREGPFMPGEVLLVDTVGELMKFYALSDLVFVGGSLAPTGGHNILEPASLGVPALFGPHMHNFRESAALLLACGGGIQVNSGDELAAALQLLLDDGAKRIEAGMNGMRLLQENSGATERQMEVIESLMGTEELGLATRTSKLRTRT
jgi:3-deoxy-D-manno-octulosonic-acid transferase